MADDAAKNIPKYKSGFGQSKKTFVKVSPLKIVNGFTTEQLNSWGMKQTTYPTPVYRGKR